MIKKTVIALATVCCLGLAAGSAEAGGRSSFFLSTPGFSVGVGRAPLYGPGFGVYRRSFRPSPIIYNRGLYGPSYRSFYGRPGFGRGFGRGGFCY